MRDPQLAAAGLSPAIAPQPLPVEQMHTSLIGPQRALGELGEALRERRGRIGFCVQQRAAERAQASRPVRVGSLGQRPQITVSRLDLRAVPAREAASAYSKATTYPYTGMSRARMRRQQIERVAVVPEAVAQPCRGRVDVAEDLTLVEVLGLAATEAASSS